MMVTVDHALAHARAYVECSEFLREEPVERVQSELRRWLAIWHQGSGCDYTLGCGISLHFFDAVDLRAATQYVVDALCDTERYADQTVDSIERVELIEITGHGTILTPNTWLNERAERKRRAREAAQEAYERAEYERLKKKFEGDSSAKPT